MDAPKLTPGKGRLQLVWENDNLCAQIGRLHIDRYGHVRGSLQIISTAPGQVGHLLVRDDYDFSADFGSALRELTGVTDTLDWRVILSYLAQYIPNWFREGEAPQVLAGKGAKRPEFLLWPLVPLNEPTVLYGSGGVGKSYLALLMAIILNLGWEKNPLHFKPLRAMRVGYLDYETTYDEVNWRIACLQRGMELPDIDITYRRCGIPLVIELDTIAKIIAEKQLTCLIVDSISLACGAVNLNESAPAVALFTGLRALNISSILVGHTSKSEDQAGRGKTPLGHVGFINAARSTIEVRGEEDRIDPRILHIGLYHRKANSGPKRKPIGVNLCFQDNFTTIEPAEPTEVDGLKEFVYITDRIIALLKRGNMSTERISEELEAKPNTVTKDLGRLIHKGVVLKLPDGTYGLATA